ncbi:MAG: NAD(P)H-dependent oxidoreductase subunit E [Planctomycetes bacterium]|nr:NAD(P)H-dependent oxidoreductase subunit E [Planctomycetota bacterium]
MDLEHLSQAPTDAETRAIDALLGPAAPDSHGAPVVHGPTPREARARRTFLLPALIALQERVGWISPGGLGYVCRRLGVPPAEAWGVATFYALLAVEERPAAFAHVCDDVACASRGAEELCSAMEARLGPCASSAHRAEPHAPRAGHAARWAKSPCLGLCDQAPAALVTVAGERPVEQAFGGATLARVEEALAGKRVAPASFALASLGPRRLLARAGDAKATTLDGYAALGGYRALERAFELGPEGVRKEVNASKLVGRGGAAFPTGRKWDAVARHVGKQRHVVCNADESEPGTFKDRVLLEQDPFAVLEAMTIAGFATGATKGWIYLRGEYPLAAERLASAITAARAAGKLGARIGGRDVAFDVALRRGAGAYICGEETALLASIEGFRGEPRTKPPFPVDVGLFGEPTAINNVETLVAALDVVRDGAASYASVGTAGSPGTKLFCLSGRVARPGVYEVPFGTPLSALVEFAGGVPGGKAITGVLLGGVAGTFVGPKRLDLALSFEAARAAGTTLGSGVVFVMDDSIELLPMLRRIAAFFRDESCGQCVPCRVGTVRQEELLARLARGAARGGLDVEKQLLAELGQAMRDASICGLGQTASSAIESAFVEFDSLGPLGRKRS